jgi:hypothetical protein
VTRAKKPPTTRPDKLPFLACAEHGIAMERKKLIKADAVASRFVKDNRGEGTQ